MLKKVAIVVSLTFFTTVGLFVVGAWTLDRLGIGNFVFVYGFSPVICTVYDLESQ